VTGISAWTCPTCGRRFARTNQRHVCGTWTVEDELDDEFAGWVRESYAVGEGKHLEQPLPR
jgi:hypothetical protein